MAADWIKMRTDLYRDPKVCAMADTLMDPKGELARHVNQNMQRDMTVTRDVTRNAVVGALLSVWGVFRHRGKRVDDDLLLRDMTLTIIDDVADLPGFGEAMAYVGWAIETEEGLVFPHFFEEHNVEPGSHGRSKAADRQARYRERKAQESDVTRDVTRDVTLRSRVEKSREEIKDKDPPPSPKLIKPKISPVPDGFVEFWSVYPRKEAKGAAVKAYGKTTEAERRVIATVLPLFVQSWKWLNEPQYIPHPATWLNQRRWEDDPPSKLPPHQPKMPPSESRQARQLRVLEETANDPRYQQTADRQLAHERHSPRLAASSDVEPAMDASAGRSSWDDDGLD